MEEIKTLLTILIYLVWIGIGLNFAFNFEKNQKQNLNEINGFLQGSFVRACWIIFWPILGLVYVAYGIEDK